MTTETAATASMPPNVARMVKAGFVRWADRAPAESLRERFDPKRIPVTGARQIRVWGVQVDDERELPGRERTQIPDEEIWEIQLLALDGTKYEVASTHLEPAG